MKSFSQIIANPSSKLYLLLQHSDFLNQLNRWVQANLPAPLNQHCYVANLREQILVVYADSSLWATRLRYYAPVFLTRWQGERFLPTIVNLEIKVCPDVSFKI
jgi:hypothetical protein